MGYVRREQITVTTNASGVSTAYIPADGQPAFNGKLSSISYARVDMSTTADFTITADQSGETLWDEDNITASKAVAPRQPTHDNVGTASLYAATFPVEDYYRLADDRIKIVLAQAGNVKTGTFTVIVEE